AIDAGVVIEPSLTAGLSRGGLQTWPGGSGANAFGGVYQARVMYYSGQFTQQSDQARRFMTGYLKGIRAFNDAFVKGIGRDEIVRLMIDNTPIKDPALYGQMQLSGLDPNGQLLRPSMQIELDYFRGRGYYTGPSTLESFIDSSFAQYPATQ